MVAILVTKRNIRTAVVAMFVSLLRVSGLSQISSASLYFDSLFLNGVYIGDIISEIEELLMLRGQESGKVDFPCT